MKYTCIPKWSTPNAKDEFDYKLQTKEEVNAQLKEWDEKGITVTPMFYRRLYPGYFDKSLFKSSDLRAEAVQAKLNLRELPFTVLQRKRLKYLVQGREKNGILKINCKRYDNYRHNLAKTEEIIKEVILEALRAPRTPVQEINNPYTRAKNEAKRSRKKKMELFGAPLTPQKP
eukprot:TRINITY_DN14700_c0_g1_i1.p1 TRINITY_DN14700_c0_g1~~TRINITY_DN14700_c0_g1_i1.p1  ORF type:complete len:173 (-),score=52.06 TRINITY_DN14700_c0_g1_i1:54-572(-)